ncbi:MAG TPA: hybrid sensor histidine kinase/response regulator [Bacteroidales bacterium]|nr:hybrid sensor histidine kinase/response regulator [Bacteroidales bacterium]
MKQAIICVDDEDIILEALKDQLGPFFENQYLIETTTTAEEALEIYDELIESGYDVPVVISDYLMPGMRGDELLIQVHKRNPKVLKILLTGHANIDGITNAINKANLYRYIPKPWDRDDLILTVREAVRSFLQELEILQKNEELTRINENLELIVAERTSELSEANATKDKFFSIIAHDLKDSLASLLGFTEMLSNDFSQLCESDTKAIVDGIHHVSDQTYRLLQNLLGWANIQIGNAPFNPDTFDLTAFILDEISWLERQASKKDIQLVFDETNTMPVVADNKMISSVFRNLVGNAIKYSHKGNPVEILVQHSNNRVCIDIIDHGVGIPEERMQKLFHVNESNKTYGTENEDGTGLGLILCKEYLLKNQGEITLRSEVGKGTTVRFCLPAAE